MWNSFPCDLPPFTHLPKEPSPTELRTRLWYSSRYPYLPYILRSPFHGDLLQRLSCPVDRIELQSDKFGWYLSKTAAKDWKALENVLVLCTKQLHSFYSQNRPKVKFAPCPPPLPSKYGYFDVHATESAARAGLATSLDAFVVYLAYFSFLAALCEFEFDAMYGKSWYKLLSKEDSGVHPEWLELLVKSPIVDFERERLGVVIDVVDCGWLHFAQHLHVAGIQFWYYWGKTPQYVTVPDASIARDCPDLNHIAPLIPYIPESLKPKTFPAVVAHSGQRPEETMEQFFERRRQRDERYRCNETAERRRAREDRERSNAKRPFPGKKGPSVFKWEDVDGYRIRTPVPRRQVENQWNSRWTAREKIYNGFDNCWDCCSLFGDDDESDAMNLSPSPSPSPGPPAQPQTPHPPSPQVQFSELAVAHSSASHPDPQNLTSLSLSLTEVLSTPADRHAEPVLDDNSDDAQMEADDLYDASSKDVLAANSFQLVIFSASKAETVEDLIYYRYGFDLHDHPYSGVPASIQQVTFRDWQEVCRSVGGQRLATSGANQKPITDFLGCLLASKSPLGYVPDKFWDLDLESPLSLNELKRFIDIEARELEGTTWFLLRPIGLHPSRNTSWVLTVDAMTALECIRRQIGPHNLDIANFLVDHGITFMTLDLLPKESIPPKVGPPGTDSMSLLGRRPKGYKFNLADYAAYVTLRDAYLSGNSHARAALCVGGIVARLAREALPNSAVLAGPSEAALRGERRVLVSNKEYFCDDDISPQVMDLICGVYHVETGNRGMITNVQFCILLMMDVSDQVSFVSWFPRHNKWSSCGLNVGQWTDECESWYVKRVQDIQAGGASGLPRSQADWRDLIHLTRKAPKLVYQMNLAASSYIKECMYSY